MSNVSMYPIHTNRFVGTYLNNNSLCVRIEYTTCYTTKKPETYNFSLTMMITFY